MKALILILFALFIFSCHKQNRVAKTDKPTIDTSADLIIHMPVIKSLKPKVYIIDQDFNDLIDRNHTVEEVLDNIKIINDTIETK